jgi:UDP-N-acetyl-D-mannosaminuronate dehydrogenase
MPAHAVKLLADSLGELKGKKVAVLGVSYRGGVKESAFSGVFGTVAALLARGADVFVNDPMYSDEEIRALGFQPYAIGERAEAVILQADHQEYKVLVKSDFPGLQAVVDGRRTLDRNNFAGLPFRVIGAGA